MQQTGTLKKRGKRHLAKVNGLINTPFDGNYGGLNIQKSADFTFRNNYTALNINSSEFAELRKNSGGTPSSRTRPTRNPMFNRDPEAALGMDNRNSEAIAELKWQDNSKKEINDRPYLLDSFTMSCLKLILFVGQTSGAMPWKWDKKTCKLNKRSPKFLQIWQIFRALFHIQTVCLTIYQIYVFIHLASSGKFTNREIFMASFSLTCYLYWVDFAVNRCIHEDQMREYFNTLFKFNYDMVNQHVIDLSNYNYSSRLLINFATLGTLNNILWCIITFLQMPNAPWNLFSYIYPKPWYWLIPGIIQTYYLYGQMLSSHTLGIWMIIAHTSTLQFWLTESHKNNSSDYTSDEIRKQKTSFEVYKSLQVLNSCFNDCISPLFIPILKIHVLGVDVVCGYIIIRSMSTLFDQDFTQFLMYPIAFTVCSIQAFITLKMSAMMYDLGISFVNSWSSTSDKNFRKTLMSCAALKVHVGRFYFITVSTTINFCQVVFGMITDAVISFP